MSPAQSSNQCKWPLCHPLSPTHQEVCALDCIMHFWAWFTGQTQACVSLCQDLRLLHYLPLIYYFPFMRITKKMTSKHMFVRVRSSRWVFKKSFPWNRRQTFCFNGCLWKLTLYSLLKQKRKVARWGQRMWSGDHRWQRTQWAADCVLWPAKQRPLPLGHSLCPAASGHGVGGWVAQTCIIPATFLLASVSQPLSVLGIMCSELSSFPIFCHEVPSTQDALDFLSDHFLSLL